MSTVAPSLSRSDRITSVRYRRSAAYFAASTAGAKERVAQGGAHLLMRDDAAPSPSTQASAPLSGSPRNHQIPWGETAPGRLGREDARNFRDRTLCSDRRAFRGPREVEDFAG